jgi:hypothetical protein
LSKIYYFFDDALVSRCSFILHFFSSIFLLLCFQSIFIQFIVVFLIINLLVRIITLSAEFIQGIWMGLSRWLFGAFLGHKFSNISPISSLIYVYMDDIILRSTRRLHRAKSCDKTPRKSPPNPCPIQKIHVNLKQELTCITLDYFLLENTYFAQQRDNYSNLNIVIF